MGFEAIAAVMREESTNRPSASDPRRVSLGRFGAGYAAFLLMRVNSSSGSTRVWFAVRRRSGRLGWMCAAAGELLKVLELEYAIRSPEAQRVKHAM